MRENSCIYKMFNGKKAKDLTTKERQEYNRLKQEEHRKKLGENNEKNN